MAEPETLVPSVFDEEIAELAQRLGQPITRTVPVNSAAFWERERAAEVCMVIRRPTGLILTFIKTFYPPEVFRLLTGGIEPGERILEALMRETHEETGLEVEVRRFLAAIGYRPEAADTSPPGFHTFAFMLDEIGGTLGAVDPEEQVQAFRDVAPSELLAIAGQLDELPDVGSFRLGERWSEWGHFRAVVHRAVYEALTQ